MGIDIYKYAGNLLLTNYLYFLGQLKWDKKKFGKVCSSFITLIRTKDKQSIEQFYTNVASLYESISDEKEKAILFPILLSHNHIEQTLDIVTKYTIDVTLSNFVVHSGFGGEKLNENLNVILDHSKRLFRPKPPPHDHS